MGIRLVGMAWWFLFGELRGIASLALIWLASAGRDTRTRRFRVYRLRQLWAAGHLGGVRRLFGLRFEIEGLEDVAPGPVLILMRHASIIDNAMPDAVVGRAHGLVVFCGHVGLDGFEYVSDIWAGGLLGMPVRVRFWRHAAAEVPRDRDELTRWLYARWQVLDDWVGAARA